MFRYFTDDEARAELAQRKAEAEKSKGNAKPADNAAATSPASSAVQKPQ